MAKTKKAARKKETTTSKKAAPGKGKAISNTNEPVTIHIIIDVNVNQQPQQKLSYQPQLELKELTKPANFSYTFTLSRVTIDRIAVDDTIKKDPGSTGSFYAEITDINNRAWIAIVGTETGGGGTASVTLKYKGKTVYQDKDLVVQGGSVSSLEHVTLP